MKEVRERTIFALTDIAENSKPEVFSVKIMGNDKFLSDLID